MAYNSTIKPKKCKCEPNCDKWPTTGFGGYYYNHAPIEIKERQGLKAKKSYQTARNRANLANLSRKVHSVQNEKNDQETPKNGLNVDIKEKWYMDRRIEMTNVCCNCGAGTNKINPKYYRWSIAHIVPKSLVPSVAINEFNWIELCQQCHQEYDNTFDKAAAMPCFEEIKNKFQLFKHLIPNTELRKVNPKLL